MTQGYGGTILKINLSSEVVTRKKTPKDLCEMYIGGKGFGAKVIYDYISHGVDPLSPENILVVSIGPASGTTIPFSSRVNFNFKSPLTGIYGEAQMGGYFAPRLKWAGVDMIILKGKASKPTYLYIDEEIAELRDADYLWGKTTYETEEIIKNDLGKDVAVMEIGPAGENLVKFACICHANGWRQAGRAGAGAVMGSKNLKAIVAAGEKRDIEVADEEKLRELTNEILDDIKRDPKGTYAENYRKYGTPIMVEIANALHFFPTRYWSKVFLEEYESISPEAMSKIFVRSRACWNCPFACGKYVEVTEGTYAGTKVEGPEYETIYAFGGLCEIDDISAIAKINDLCDKYGIDTITMGNVAAFAIEAYQRGKLKSSKPLNYSDPQSVIWLIENVVKKEGIGIILSEGVKKAAEVLNLEDLAIHCKGLEPPGYDPRSLPGMALAYATSPRGACHLRAVMYAVDISGKIDRFSISKDKVALCVNQENRFTIFDTMVLCRFSRALYNWDRIKEVLNALTGFNYKKSTLWIIAERIRTIIRLFNLKCGVSSKDDTIPEVFFKNPVTVIDKKLTVNKKELEDAVKEYYSLRGWNEKGIPQHVTLEKLKISYNTRQHVT